MTTGPWKAIGQYVEAENGALVAKTLEMTMKTPQAQSAEKAKAEENARMIAALPDLLDAVQCVKEWTEREVIASRGTLLLRQILEKARQALP